MVDCGMLNDFLSPASCALKICGVTTTADAEALIACGVDALGVNFYPKSKRYITPADATEWLKSSAGRIVRVGVFVNADPSLPKQLLEDGLLDMVQFHGDEDLAYCQPFIDAKLPFIKAIGVNAADSLNDIASYGANALLLDAPAPGVYGGTGHTFDWNHARTFMQSHAEIPVMLAGGITPANAQEAVATVRPACIDIASGAEISPGIKDLDKVKAIQAAMLAAQA